MTDLKLACMGSIILYSENDPYCSICPLRLPCSIAVEANVLRMAEELGKPASRLEAAQLATVQKRASAAAQSNPIVVTAPKRAVAPAKAPASPARHAPMSAPPGYRTPLDAMSLDGLPTKVRERLGTYNVKGIDLSKLIEGLNPFLNMHGCSFDVVYVESAQAAPRNKRQLCDDLLTKLVKSDGQPWSLGSVQSNVNIVGGALLACGYNLLRSEV